MTNEEKIPEQDNPVAFRWRRKGTKDKWKCCRISLLGTWEEINTDYELLYTRPQSDEIDALIHDNKRLYESLNSEASERCRLEDENGKLLEAVKEVDVLIRNELLLDRTTPAWKMIKEILYKSPYPIDPASKPNDAPSR